MKPITLRKVARGTGTETMLDESETAYQVPTGKVFIALTINHYQNIAQVGDGVRLFDSNTINTADGNQVAFFAGYTEQHIKRDTYAEFTALKYVTISPNDAGTTIYATIEGVEMDTGSNTPITIGNNLVKWVRTSDMKVKTLYKPLFSTSTQTLHDADTGANYQVPTGKIFIGLQLSHRQLISQASDHIKIRASATADTADGSILGLYPQWDEDSATHDVYLLCTANEYPTAQPNDAGTAVTCMLEGVEMDA